MKMFYEKDTNVNLIKEKKNYDMCWLSQEFLSMRMVSIF